MEKEKMMDLWRKTFENGYCDWKLTPQVYEYFEGKSDELIGPGNTGRKYYAYYENWLVKELDGENAELARRMLVVISKIRNGGLVSGGYNIQSEVDIALRIGYDFESLIKETIHKHRDISVKTMYGLAGRLLEYFPGESEAFADRLLKDDQKEMIEKRKNNREIYLALYMAVHLLKLNPVAYARFLPVLISIPDKIGGEHVLAMLHHSYRFSPELKDLLLKQVESSTQACRTLYFFGEPKEFLPLLKDLGASVWPYYYLVITDAVKDIDKAAVMNKLYLEDKETFMTVYDRLLKGNNTQELVYIPLLLGIMLRSGNGQAELQECGVPLIASFKRLLSEYADYKESFEDILDESIPLAKVRKIRVDRGLNYGIGMDILEGYGTLYDYSSRARRFIDFLMWNDDKTPSSYNNGGHNKSYVAGFFVLGRKKWLGIEPHQSLMALINNENTFSIEDSFKLYCLNCWNDSLTETVAEAVTNDFILENKQKAFDVLTSGLLNVEETQEWLDLIYDTYKLTDYVPLIGLLSNKSKLIRRKAEELISDREEDIRELLEERISKLKGDALMIAKRIIKKWDNERKFGANFSFQDNRTVIEFCTDNYDEMNEKFISWIPEDMLTDVRFADLSEKAPAIVLKYLLSEYLSLEEAYKIKPCDMVVAYLNPQDFQAVLENIYQLWKDNGAEAKKKMVMVPYCIYGSDSQILRLKTQLKDWAEASRGAVAAFVVNAIAMNGGSVALMMIDSMAVKFPNNQVKNAAKAAFGFAAKALEIPEDELSDKIVPTLGFNREGEKELDYGPRTFKITLMPDFSLTIYDNEKQKNIKSMPAPGANDDTVKATAAKKEFSELKKQMKATVQSQTNRLEKVLMNGRRWNVSAWNTLFVENPIMYRFATGLIWGIYDNDKLTDTFRYMEDGTFNTVDEEEYSLPENAQISLVHPIELTSETAAQWQEQLDDYEVIQPLPQLTAPVVALEEKDMAEKKVIRYSNSIVDSGKISGIAKKYNMVRGEIWDGGSYTCFHWVDKFLNMAAQLNFEYMYMGQEFNDDVTLGDVIFYRLNEDQSTNDEPKSNVILSPREIPARFLSTVIGAFDQLIEIK